VAALAIASTPAGALAQGAGCQFILGFKALHDLDPQDIGACADDQAFAPNGDAQQHTANGLMAWRKVDNWTAFTNGYWTWINGPQGLVKRLNNQRFGWEANPDNLPVLGASSQGATHAPPQASLPSAPPQTSTSTLDPVWASQEASKFATIGGISFNFVVRLNGEGIAIPDLMPIVLFVMDDSNGQGLLWLKVPQDARTQAVKAMLQDVKAHWSGKGVGMNVEGTPSYSDEIYSSDCIYQGDYSTFHHGFYTVSHYAIALFDPSFGDDIKMCG